MKKKRTEKKDPASLGGFLCHNSVDSVCLLFVQLLQNDAEL